ncbi:hypothetical protein SRHO_G00113810 [Serrasalmus rhombeus]
MHMKYLDHPALTILQSLGKPPFLQALNPHDTRSCHMHYSASPRTSSSLSHTATDPPDDRLADRCSHGDIHSPAVSLPLSIPVSFYPLIYCDQSEPSSPLWC